MHPLIHQWTCTGVQHEENLRRQYGPAYNARNEVHDGLTFVWDGVTDPFQPETATFAKLVRDGFRPNGTDRMCRCGNGLRYEWRAASAEEAASYLASKKVRVPAEVIAVPTGVMTSSAEKLLHEQFAAVRDELKELRQLMGESHTTRDGRTLLLSGMDDAHVVNTVNFLLRKTYQDLVLTGRKATNVAEAMALTNDSRLAPMVAEAKRRSLFTEVSGFLKHREMTTMPKTEEGELAVPEKKSLLGKIKESTVVKSVTAETKDASWRGAALMTIDLAKSCLEKAKPFLPKQYQKFHKPLMEFVATPLGGSALAYAAGALLSAPFVPGAGTGKQKRIAYELRVNATTVAGYTLIKPLVGFMTNVAFSGFAGILASVPDIEDGVRVDATTEEEADEGAEVLAAHNERVSAKNAAKK